MNGSDADFDVGRVTKCAKTQHDVSMIPPFNTVTIFPKKKKFHYS